MRRKRRRANQQGVTVRELLNKDICSRQIMADAPLIEHKIPAYIYSGKKEQIIFKPHIPLLRRRVFRTKEKERERASSFHGLSRGS